MSTLWLAALVLTAPPSAGASPSLAGEKKIDSSVSDLRQAQDLRRQVSRALRREATTEGAENQAAIHDLVALHLTLGSDTKLTKDERKRLRGVIRSRLMRVSKRIEREIARAKAKAKRERRKPDSIQVPVDLKKILSQQINNFGQGMARGAQGNDPGEALIELIKTTLQPGTWDDLGGPGVIRLYPPLGVLHQHLGGPGAALAGGIRGGGVALPGAAGGGAVEDYGEELVELIQQVIAPQSWDVNGGPGVAFYFRPLRVLVIRQTAEIHGRLGDVVGQLRQAGN